MSTIQVTGKRSDLPNILLIIADQLTPFMMESCGNALVPTPNIERLRRGGVSFTSAYTPVPLCTPARASLMSGLDASSLSCWDNASPFPADTPTAAHYLTNAGYETVLSGKMHFIGPDQLHGFEKRLTTDIYPSSFEWLPERDRETGRIIGGGAHARMYTSREAGVRPWSRGMSYDEETQFRALDYLHNRNRQGSCRVPQKGEEAQRPFFLCVSYHHPHDPFHVTKDLWDRFEGVDLTGCGASQDSAFPQSMMDRWLNEDYHRTDLYPITSRENLQQVRRAYAALVTYIDDKVGELLKALEDQKLLENTLIIFTSDHGEMLGERGMVQKRCFYEWSARVPLFVRLPGSNCAGRVCRAPVSLLDIAPTLVDLTASHGGIVFDPNDFDGTSLSGVLVGREEPQRYAFSEYVGEGVLNHCAMVRKGEFKYLRVHRHDEQLFNVENDPNELVDLSERKEYQSTLHELRQLVEKRFDSETIEQEVKLALKRRIVIRDAMRRSGRSWDYQAHPDASMEYHR